jgi:hypothetical protein
VQHVGRWVRFSCGWRDTFSLSVTCQLLRLPDLVAGTSSRIKVGNVYGLLPNTCVSTWQITLPR